MERPPDSTPLRRAAAASGERRASGAAWLLVGVGCTLAAAALLERAPGNARAILVATLASQVLFACTAIGGARIAGPALLPRGLRLGRPALGAGALAGVALGFVCLSHGLSLVLVLLGVRDSGTLGEIDRVVAGASGPALLLALLAIGIAPAFGEELLFRGLVQQLALPRLGAAAAILISALAFGALHVDPVHTPTAFVLGLYLGVAVELGAGLRGAIFCHALNNVLAVLGPSLAAGSPAVRVALGLAGLLVAGAALLAVVAVRGREPKEAHPEGTQPTASGVG